MAACPFPILHGHRTNDPLAVERFRREMEAVGRVQHEQIVQAHDAGTDAGVHYLVMDYVEGYDLSSVVSRLGPLRVADACEIVRQVSTALQYADDRDLVHRDVKPSNLMLTPGGQVKLLDLGLARLEEAGSHVEELTDAGQVMGTWNYMAPEQCDDSHKVDIRADLYSLGCAFYELLCGTRRLVDRGSTRRQRRSTPMSALFRLPSKPHARKCPRKWPRSGIGCWKSNRTTGLRRRNIWWTHWNR